MCELKLRYRAYDFSESIALFVTGGFVLHRIYVDAENVNDGQRTQLVSVSEMNFGGKAGVGLQWDFADSWGAL